MVKVIIKNTSAIRICLFNSLLASSNSFNVSFTFWSLATVEYVWVKTKPTGPGPPIAKGKGILSIVDLTPLIALLSAKKATAKALFKVTALNI